MALAYALKASVSGNGSTNTLATGSFTPSDGALLLIVSSALVAAGHTSPSTISGGGLTWTQRRLEYHADTGGWASEVIFWTAPVATGAAMTVTIDYHQNNLDGAAGRAIDVIQFTGHDTAAPVAQTFGDGGFGVRSGAYSGALAAAPAASGYVVTAATANANATAAAFTPLTGFTEISEVIQTYFGASHSYRTGSASTAVGMDMFDPVIDYTWSIASIEITAAADAGGTGWVERANIAGPVGPAGPTGPVSTVPGPAGATGPQGIAGDPGICTVAASAPGSPQTGRMWFRTTDKTLQIWTGSAWEIVVGTWA